MFLYGKMTKSHYFYNISLLFSESPDILSRNSRFSFLRGWQVCKCINIYTWPFLFRLIFIIMFFSSQVFELHIHNTSIVNPWLICHLLTNDLLSFYSKCITWKFCNTVCSFFASHARRLHSCNEVLHDTAFANVVSLTFRMRVKFCFTWSSLGSANGM